MLLAAVSETSIRDRKARATRARIAEAALQLFVSQGYAETTIDQIAAAANVGRRTVFRHFATKQAILLDHLVVRREAALQLLRERPPVEPPLVSLHAVLRELCEQGYDRRALSQIRSVLAAGPGTVGADLASGTRTFLWNVVATLQRRFGDEWSFSELYALTLMAGSWFETAVTVYFKEGRTSLVECFDEAVAICRQSTSSDLVPSLRGSTDAKQRCL